MTEPRYIRAIGIIGTAFMVLIAVYTVLYVIIHGSSEGYLLMRVQFPLTGSYYSPTAYNVLTIAGLYFAFYKRLGSRSIAMSMLLWGGEDLIAFGEKGIFKTVVAHGVQSATLSLPVLLESIAIDMAVVVVGLVILTPYHFKLKLTLGKTVSIVMVLIGSAYTVVTQNVGYNGFSDLGLNVVSYLTIFGLFLYLYQIVEVGDGQVPTSQQAT